MKKFLLIALVVALGATSALAGDFSAKGKYMLQGFSGSIGSPYDVSDAWWINDFEVVTTLTSGDVSAVIDWEIVDSNYKELAGNAIIRNGNKDFAGYYWDDIVDQYWLTAKLAEGLTLKTGKYYLQWGNAIAIYKQGGYNTGVTYSGLDMVDLGLTVAKVGEGYDLSGNIKDADYDQYLLSASFKKAGPFTKLNFYVVYQTVADGIYYLPYDASGWDYDYDFYGIGKSSDTLIGAEFAIPAGPVALAGELGTMSGDILDGDYLLLTAGFKGLVGFDLNAGLYYSSKPDAGKTFGLGEGWSPLLILLNNDTAVKNRNTASYAGFLPNLNPGNGNMTLFWLNGSYPVNDKLTLAATILPYAVVTDTTGDDAIGTEIDVMGTYKFNDQFSWMAGYGMFTAGDAVGDFDVSGFTTKLSYTF